MPDPPVRVDMPKGLSDLELFRRFCTPLGSTDLWDEVAWQVRLWLLDLGRKPKT